MPIISSSYVSDAHTQLGGGRWTTETHVSLAEAEANALLE